MSLTFKIKQIETIIERHRSEISSNIWLGM